MCRNVCLNPFNHLRHELVDLPCGCQDVRFACGCICREHAHAHCDAQLEESR